MPVTHLPLQPTPGDPNEEVLESMFDFCPIKYIFIIDRSGSMSENNHSPMEAAKAALKIFIQSIPQGA